MALSSQEDCYFHLAQKVFIEFARFEYCLKITGFLKKKDGIADPDWDAFSNCEDMKQLYEDIRSRSDTNFDKMRYIVEKPPRVRTH